jgi:putative CocE/NonD family hydrolase
MTGIHLSLILFIAAIPSITQAATRDVLIETPDGATLSATLALPDPLPAERLPTLFEFTIYTDPERHAAEAGEYAARGYAGIIANVRGKGRSTDAIVPYEHDAADTQTVLDWIVRQPWSDGRVGMLGGSYSGFTAWAATRSKHPALKALAVSAAAIPGQGLPMHNNVFLTANYAWAFHVTNNRTMDHTVYADRERWDRMTREWFASGRPYRELDAVDGTPNPLLQRWLRHPAFDGYWQRMVPYGRDFARIDIPVLSITGYYDDGQVSALQYFKEHIGHRRQAEHYLVVGPYDHLGTHARSKPEVLRDYPIDAVARFDSRELKLAFLDYVLRGRDKPELLVDRVNLQVMGANRWRHAANLDALHGVPMRLYFTDEKTGSGYSLANRAPPATSKVVHEVDLADRVKLHNFHAYPAPIIQGPLRYVTETIFSSAPFESGATVLGSFRGELQFVTNKKDFDLGVTVYEAMRDGKLFHLGYALQRASFADNPAKRRLLSPGRPQRLKFETTLVGRQLAPGSRLLVLVDVNKHPMAQVNYGTGKDVSDESVKDAGEPLRIEISSGSYFEIPLE